MARLSPGAYLHHIESESTRLRDVLASCDPATRVPSCPDWTAADLLGHHGGVLEFWATVVEGRPAGPDDLDDPAPPSAYDELLAHHEAQATRLVAALSAADPTEPAWTWSPEQTVGFTFRRQAHEALVHRVDAELTAGATTALDPALAADGVDEALDVMLGGTPPWGTFTAYDRFVLVDCTDTGDRVWVQLGRFHGTDPGGDHARPRGHQRRRRARDRRRRRHQRTRGSARRLALAARRRRRARDDRRPRGVRPVPHLREPAHHLRSGAETRETGVKAP